MQLEDSPGSVLVRAEIAFRIRPVLAPTSSCQGNRACGDAQVPAFPLSNVRSTYKIVGILLACGSHIEHNRRRNQPVNWNLVRPGMPLGKVQRTVEMRSAMLTRAVTRRSIEISARSRSPLIFSPLEAISCWPIDGVFVKAVSEIDKLRVRQIRRWRL